MERIKPTQEFTSPDLSEQHNEVLSSNELAMHMLNINALMRDLDRLTDGDFDKLFRKWPIDQQIKFKQLVEKNLPSAPRIS